MAKKHNAKTASRKTSDTSERVPFPKVMKVFETNDGFENFATRIGMGQNNQQSAGGYASTNYISRNRMQLENAYRSSWVVGAFIDYKAEDMTRAGITITSNDEPDSIKAISQEIRRLQVLQSFREGIQWGNLYGGAIAVIQIDGQDLATPLNLDTIGKDQFKGLAIYDRWQLQPDLQDIIVDGPDMGLPAFYTIVTTNGMIPTSSTVGGSGTGMRVHHSRCIRFIGIKLPHFQAITEMMWGESQIERLWDRLMSFDNATLSAGALIDRANLRTISVKGLRQILAMGGKSQQALEAMFDSIRLLQNNMGLTVIDADDKMDTTTYSFAGLSDMMLQFGQQLSGATGIPLVRFFGQSPAGMSATGESDLRMYYDNINAQQEAKLRNPFEVVVRVMWRSLFGSAPPVDLSFNFTPLWQMSAMDKANIAKLNAETVIGAHDAGLTSAKITLQELRADSGATGLFSNITDEDIEAADAEVPPAPEMGEGGGDLDPASAPPKLSVVSNDSAYVSPHEKIKAWLSRN